jgi:hypothetical protein
MEALAIDHGALGEGQRQNGPTIELVFTYGNLQIASLRELCDKRELLL